MEWNIDGGYHFNIIIILLKNVFFSASFAPSKETRISMNKKVAKTFIVTALLYKARYS